MTKNEEIKIVKQIGEKIGYGNLMMIASALWKSSMEKQNYPTSGVFVPTCKLFIKKGFYDKREELMYDKLIEIAEKNN